MLAFRNIGMKFFRNNANQDGCQAHYIQYGPFFYQPTNSMVKPLSHWDAKSPQLYSKLYNKLIRQTVAKPTVAKLSHGIAKSSHASHNGSWKVWTCSKILCDTISCKTNAKSSHVLRTRREPIVNPSQNFRRHIASQFLRSTQCNKYEIQMQIDAT